MPFSHWDFLILSTKSEQYLNNEISRQMGFVIINNILYRNVRSVRTGPNKSKNRGNNPLTLGFGFLMGIFFARKNRANMRKKLEHLKNQTLSNNQQVPLPCYHVIDR